MNSSKNDQGKHAHSEDNLLGKKQFLWHLATNTTELILSDFELSLWRVFNSFTRWQQDCEAAIASDGLIAEEIGILHIIRMGDRPKTIYEIGNFLNRTDMPNIQYTVRALS